MVASLSPLSSREHVTFWSFRVLCTADRKFFTSPPSRHPERSAARIYPRNGRLSGAESKDPGDACWQMLFRAFQPQTTSEIKRVPVPSEAKGSVVHRPRIGYDQSTTPPLSSRP